jgi:transposase
MMEVPDARHLEDLDVPNATFDDPDLTTFTAPGGAGPGRVGQRLTAERAVLECRLAEEDPWCRSLRSTSDVAGHDRPVSGA